MKQKILDFLSAVLPSTGIYVSAINNGDKISQKIFYSHEELSDFFIAISENSNVNCWFSPASYKKGWHEVFSNGTAKRRLRTKENVCSVKSLWLDVDVGDNKSYKTRKEASAAIASFVKSLGLPRPWVIGSGSKGLHLYFTFLEEIEKERWLVLAEQLKSACQQNGLFADPVRTADAASIMRSPYTWNSKGTPARVEILVVGKSESVAVYEQLLSKFPYRKIVTPVSLEKPLLVDNEFIQALANIDILGKYFTLDQSDTPKRNPYELINNCAQLREQAGAIEPVWRGMLATIRLCEDGVRVAHELSAKDSRYNFEDTQNKINYLETNGILPYTCNTFHSLRPELCENCAYRGILNSPMGIPRGTTISTLPTNEPDVSVVGNDVAEIQEPRTVETSNSLVNAAGCWVRVNQGDDGWKWKKIYPYPVYPLQRVRGRSVKGETSISYIFRKHSSSGYDDIQIAGSTIMGQNLNSTLGDFGFLLNEKERRLMAGLLIDILKATEASIGEVLSTDRLGWNDSYDSFLLGNKVYKTDGTVINIAVSGKAKVYSDSTCARGSLDVWKQIANVYSKKGLEWGQVVVASAFASPLMPIGSLEKAALLFVTGEKGVGKSTALLMASSVFGDPERLMFNKMDTFNSRIHKLGIISNIAATFDEMTDMSAKEASEFAYTLTQGRGKDRMGSGGEDLIMNTTYWSCLPVMSANDSIINALSQHGLDPTAQMSRVLEITATDINKFYTAEEVEANERLVRQLPHNFGVAGDKYIRYITANKETVIDMVAQIEKKFKAYAELNSSYRFWTYMCTRMLVGILIANRLELVSYDITNLFHYLVNIVKRARKEIDKYKWTPDSAIPQFISYTMPNRIVVAYAKRPKEMPDNENTGFLNDVNYVVKPPAPGRELSVRVELDTNNTIISIPAMKEWCKKAGIAYAEFLRLLENQYEIVSKRTRRDLGSQTVFRSGAPTECVIVKMPSNLFVDEQE